MAAISRARPRHAPTLRQLPGAQTALETESPAPLGAAARQPAPGRREPGLGGRPPAPRPPLSPALYQKHERGADYAYSSREFLEKSSWLPTNSYELLKLLWDFTRILGGLQTSRGFPVLGGPRRSEDRIAPP